MTTPELSGAEKSNAGSSPVYQGLIACRTPVMRRSFCSGSFTIFRRFRVFTIPAGFSCTAKTYGVLSARLHDLRVGVLVG